MPTISSPRLLNLLLAALPGAELLSDPGEGTKPALLRVPEVGPVRIYMWTITPDRSAGGVRPAGEYKMQVIVPGGQRGRTQILSIDECPTFLMGFSPEFGVFCTWEARYHARSAYSKNVQVREVLLESAASNGWAADSRSLRASGALEVRTAVIAPNLARLLRVSIEADVRDLSGHARYIFMLAHSPELDDFDVVHRTEAGEEVLAEEIETARAIVMTRRLERDRRFARAVLQEYDYRCAICTVQMNVVEAAHIIPVHHPASTDQPWNGIALCRNHHRLYDNGVMVVSRDLTVATDEEFVQFLHEAGRAEGIESLLRQFEGRAIRHPRSFEDRRFRQSMMRNIDINIAMRGLQG